MLPALRTNVTGKVAIGVGIVLLVGWLVFGLKDGFQLFERQLLITAAIGLGLVFVGLYLRPVGTALMWVGGAVALLALLHALLVELFGIRTLALSFSWEHSSGQIDALAVFSGALAAALGFLFSRDEQDEAVIYRDFAGQVRAIGRKMADASAASAQRQRRQRAHERGQSLAANRRRAPAAHARSGPRCPNCRAEAAGTFLAGNRVIDCLACGGTFCGSCAKGIFSKACPHCGNDDQNRIKFRDTGASWV